MFVKFNKYGRNISVSNSSPYAEYAGNSMYYDSYGNFYFEIPGDASKYPYRNDYGEIYEVGDCRFYYDDDKRMYEIYKYNYGSYRFYYNDDGLLYEANGIRIYYTDSGRMYEINNRRVY